MKYLLLPIIVLAGCAHAASMQGVMELKEGFRPQDGECEVFPPTTHEGGFERADFSCMYVEGGPASCSYMSRIYIGLESWFCVMGALQPSCDGAWDFKEFHCVQWNNDYQKVMDNIKHEVEPPRSKVDGRHVHPTSQR